MVRDTVIEMLQKGVIEKTQGDVILSYPFKVPEKDSDKPWFVLDLSILNIFIEAFSFRMLTVGQVRLHLTQGDCLTAIDMKDGYWHILTHKY